MFYRERIKNINHNLQPVNAPINFIPSDERTLLRNKFSTKAAVLSCEHNMMKRTRKSTGVIQYIQTRMQSNTV